MGTFTRIGKCWSVTRKRMMAMVMCAVIIPGTVCGFERTAGDREVAAKSLGQRQFQGNDRFDFYLPPSPRDRSYDWDGDGLAWQHGPTLRLRKPDAFPGLELGIESYSFGSLHWLAPRVRLPRGYDFDLRDYMPAQPFGSMDHTGAVLRFRW